MIVQLTDLDLSCRWRGAGAEPCAAKSPCRSAKSQDVDLQASPDKAALPAG